MVRAEGEDNEDRMGDGVVKAVDGADESVENKETVLGSPEVWGGIWWSASLGLGAVEVINGVVLVGAELMYWVIRSGTREGVTLSIMVKDGKSRTVVGADAEWSCSEFAGTGMLEADSIIFYVIWLEDCNQQTRHKDATYTIGGFSPTVPHCFHDTPFLVLHIPYPVCLACCDEKMCCPFIDMAV